MRVLILTHGSRGDVEPFVALAKSLKSSGHHVTFGAPAEFMSLTDKPFYDWYVPFNDRFKYLINDQSVRERIENNFRGVSGGRRLLNYYSKLVKTADGILHDFAETIDSSADTVVHHSLLPGHYIAEFLGVPSVPVGLAPGYLRTSLYPDVSLPFQVPRWLNRASYLWSDGQNLLLMPNVSRWRAERLELPRRRRGHRDVLNRPDGGQATALQCFSQYIGSNTSSQSIRKHTTGYWFLRGSSSWEPTKELRDFLNAGREQPVFIGLGSVVGCDPYRIGSLVLDAIQIASVRAIIVEGWGGIKLQQLPESVHVENELPYSWLFRKVKLIIHHGGIGTIGEALAAGRPQIICPANAATRKYARLVEMCGVAPHSLPFRELTAEKLADAIRMVAPDPTMQARAHDLSLKVKGEGGADAAVRTIESVVENP